MYGRDPQPAYRPTEIEPTFVQEIRPGQTTKGNPRVTRLIIIGWALIAIKSVVVWWACAHYALPFHPLWVIAPTVAFAALCTGVYGYARR
jgi:hypothetical protein